MEAEVLKCLVAHPPRGAGGPAAPTRVFGLVKFGTSVVSHWLQWPSVQRDFADFELEATVHNSWLVSAMESALRESHLHACSLTAVVECAERLCRSCVRGLVFDDMDFGETCFVQGGLPTGRAFHGCTQRWRVHSTIHTCMGGCMQLCLCMLLA